jgi:hypothetical protein
MQVGGESLSDLDTNLLARHLGGVGNDIPSKGAHSNDYKGESASISGVPAHRFH